MILAGYKQEFGQHLEKERNETNERVENRVTDNEKKKLSANKEVDSVCSH